MLGTIVNVCAIAAGSLLGCCLKKGIGEKYNEMLMDVLGLSALCMGASTVVHAIPDSRYHVLFIISMALGGLIGTRIDIAAGFDRVVTRLSHGSDLARGLSTAILLYCVGTMSILGPMKAALERDYSFLFINATLDGITSIVLASTFGLGIALAAVVLFFWQGSIYLLATFIEPYVTQELLTELSIVGGALILCSGLNNLRLKDIKVMNLLPSLLIAPLAVVVLRHFGI